MPKRRRPFLAEPEQGNELKAKQLTSVDAFRDSLQFVETLKHALLSEDKRDSSFSFETNDLRELSIKDQIQKAIDESTKSKFRTLKIQDSYANSSRSE